MLKNLQLPMHVKKKYIPKIEEKTNTEKNINPSRIKKKKKKTRRQK